MSTSSVGLVVGLAVSTVAPFGWRDRTGAAVEPQRLADTIHHTQPSADGAEAPSHGGTGQR
jgi:hypothetical protein